MLMVMLMLVMRLVLASVARHSPDYNLRVISEGCRQVSWDTGRHVDVCTTDRQRVTATECYHRSQLQGMSLLLVLHADSGVERIDPLVSWSDVVKGD